LHYVCLLPEKHALAQSVKPIDLETLKGAQYVAYDRARLQTAQKDWLQLLSWPQADLSSYSNIAVASLARATGKLAIIDPYTAKTVAALGGVVTRPIRQRLISTLCVVGRGIDTLSLAARELADAVIAELKTT
jgi:hypothetical protein